MISRFRARLATVLSRGIFAFCRRIRRIVQNSCRARFDARSKRGTESSNPTLGSFGRSKNARDSAILGDQINGFCPRFCPRRKAIKEPGWCGLDAPGQQFIHPSPANLAVTTDVWPKTSKTCRNPGHLRYPRLHPACSQEACQGRARAPQSTMTKVGKSHSKGTFAEVFGNDEDAPDSGPSRPRPGTERFDAKEPIAPTSDRTPTESAKEHEKCRSQR